MLYEYAIVPYIAMHAHLSDANKCSIFICTERVLTYWRMLHEYEYYFLDSQIPTDTFERSWNKHMFINRKFWMEKIFFMSIVSK